MSELIDELLADARERMGKSVEATQGEFNSVRTGRASPSLLDRVQVDYYGTPTPLKQLAGIHAEAQLLTVQPYDQNSIKSIEKAIRDSDLGVNPSNDGKLIRCVFPELTEERRSEELRIAMSQMENVPEQARERAAQGKLGKWLDEVVLLRQQHVNQDKHGGKTIEQLRAELSAKTGENVVIKRFARFEVGV